MPHSMCYSHFGNEVCNGAISVTQQGSNVSTTPIPAMGCQQCVALSVVHLKGEHCRKPHCRSGKVLLMIGLSLTPFANGEKFW